MALLIKRLLPRVVDRAGLKKGSWIASLTNPLSNPLSMSQDTQGVLQQRLDRLRARKEDMQRRMKQKLEDLDEHPL